MHLLSLPEGVRLPKCVRNEYHAPSDETPSSSQVQDTWFSSRQQGFESPWGRLHQARGFCRGPGALVKGVLVFMPAVLCLSMLLGMAVPPPSLQQ